MRILYIPAISLAMLLSSCNKINIQREFVRIHLHADNSNTITNEAIYRKKTLLKSNDNKISYLPIIYTTKLSEVSKKNITIKETNTEFILPESNISNSSYFDTMKPLHDNKQRLLFSQLGIRCCDQRNIANLGIGQRYFYKNWLLGYNVFYDIQASSNHHQRLGIGGELRNNFLYLAINSHYGLTDWQSSFEKIDYEENVAHGYDILAQGWLPIYPQLSGKMKFEQFFTKKFTPSRTKKHIKDLFKLTLGVDYQPVPLLTFGIDHSFNYAGHGDTKLGVYINYQPGISLSKLISSAEVTVINPPAENRYRLVERNNDITLRYRQRARINRIFPNKIKDSNDIIKVIDSTRQRSSYGLQILQCDNEALQMFDNQVIKLATKNYITNFLSCNPQLNNCIIFFAKNIYNNPSNPLNKETTVFVIHNYHLTFPSSEMI